MAPPGWPDLAFSTMAADNTRILSAAELMVLMSIADFDDEFVVARRGMPGSEAARKLSNGSAKVVIIP